MNTLYIIGNGFDLAHGLKTSYSDFLLWYLKQCVEKMDYLEYKDCLLSLKGPCDIAAMDKVDSIDKLFKFLKHIFHFFYSIVSFYCFISTKTSI